MIYDCSLFYKQLDLLEIRLHELDPYVDRFVIVESSKTMQNKPKELEFKEHRYSEIFDPFKTKIIYVTGDPKLDDDTWGNERKIFNMISAGLTEARDEDFLMVSFGDEIPKGTSIPVGVDFVKEYPKDIFGFTQRNYRYFINTRLRDYWPMWFGTRICSFSMLKNLAPYDVRFFGAHTPSRVIPDGGWHYSWTGGAEQMLDKVQSFAHKDFLGWTIETARVVFEEGRDCWTPDKPHACVAYTPFEEEDVPRYVMENKEKFKYLIRDKPFNDDPI